MEFEVGGPTLEALLDNGDLDILRHDDSFRTPMAGAAGTPGPGDDTMNLASPDAHPTPQTASTAIAHPTNQAGQEMAMEDQTSTAQAHTHTHTHTSTFPAVEPIAWRESSCQGNTFVLPGYYQVVRTLGSGAYGVVCHATDTRLAPEAEAHNVAIKKIARAFEHAVDARRTIREVKLLREMRHDNIITLLDILPPVDLASFNDYYVVYQFMETDLHQIIRSQQELSEDHIQYFVYQILRGIKYVHSLGVVHRDLKPSNLLLNGNCDLKICDFGLARALGPADDNQSFLTEYVGNALVSRSRSPSLVVSLHEGARHVEYRLHFSRVIGPQTYFPRQKFPRSD